MHTVCYFGRQFDNSYLIFRASQVAIVVQNLPANARGARDMGLVPGSGRPLGVRNGTPVQYSCLGDSMARGALWATVL